jgi:acyl dehydratase
MVALKERRWEVMEVGEEFGPLRVKVDERLLRDFAYAVDDFDPVFLWSDGEGRRIGHPTLLCREARDVIATHYDIASGGAGMHAKHALEIHACPEIGETVTVTGRHAEKFLKRGKQYIVLESEVHAANGALLLRQRSTHIRALEPGVARTAGPAPAPQAPQAPIGIATGVTEIRPGVALPTLRRRFTQEMLTVFAGCGWSNIHNDPAIARKAGLRGTVASGLQSMAAVSSLIHDAFGRGWREGGRLDVAFTASCFVDETIEAGATVTDIQSEGGRRFALLDLRCDTDAGVRVLAGTARAWLD